MRFTILLLLIVLMTGCSEDNGETLLLATTTSTENSGLLEEILPDFEQSRGIDVRVIAVGTGAALDLGREKDADVLLVHAPEEELRFVEEGYGTERFSVMYNDFIIIGPPEDPADLMEKAPTDVLEALRLIWQQEAAFISRGDHSGTHVMELKLLEQAGLSAEGDHYVSAGQGMGAVIEMTDEMQGYTLADRGTYLSMGESFDLEVVTEGEELLYNPYGVIPVSQDDDGNINRDGAEAFVQWILSDEVQQMIGAFGTEDFGEPLFFPEAPSLNN